LQKALLVTNGLRLLNLKHTLGIVLFGIFPYIILPEFRTLIETIEIPKLYILIPFFLVLFLSVYLSLTESKKQSNNFGSNKHLHGLISVLLYFTVRFTFLLSYEYFFRGVLFFNLLQQNSLILAITYGTILYVLIHLFDSKKEILGAIPFGIILCLFSYFTNSIWYPFLIHLALSAVYEITIVHNLTLKNKMIS
jgi:membrane protease YdiL (CAAX protease family)